MQDSNDISEIETFIATDSEIDERIDKVLANRYSEIQSRQYFQNLITQDLVRVNGRTVKKKDKLDLGDEVEIQFVLTPEIALDPEDIPLDILYEDAHLLAINKPAGMVVHPAPGNWHGTFVNALLHHCCDLEGDTSQLRPGIVHRLDKDTTGVLIAAKTTQMHQKLVTLFSTRQVHKEYLAVCIGNPGKGEVDAPIGRHPTLRKQMAVVSEKGRHARTLFATIASAGELSLVRITLVTGRTHQARVHMRHVGFPILGDPIYGRVGLNERYGLSRQMLHAALLKFLHPETGQEVSLAADFPEDMSQLINKAKLL